MVATRPILHKCDDTIRLAGGKGLGPISPTRRGAVFCSFLALALRKELQDRLAAAGLDPEWAEVLRDLDRLQEVEVAQDGKRFVLRTPVVGRAGKLFRNHPAEAAGQAAAGMVCGCQCQGRSSASCCAE
jgi:hypothetical protein